MPDVNDIVLYHPYAATWMSAYGLIVETHVYPSGNKYVQLRFLGKKGLGNKKYSYLAKRVTVVDNIRDLMELEHAECP
jgi:hypothetical protein